MSEINHKLESGMVLYDNYDGQITVEEINEDGSIDWSDEDGDVGTWTEEEICGALVDGNLQTNDGESHELVKHF